MSTTAKAKEAVEKTEIIPVLYDPRIAQAIPLTLDKNGVEYRVVHNLDPLPFERFYQFAEDVEELGRRIKKITTAIYGPKHKLWKELVTSREGYKDREDWKESTHQLDAVAAINALIFAQTIEDDPQSGGDLLYDDEALTTIQFRAMQSGVLMTLSHSFAEESKADMDAFLAIEADEPVENELAGAQKLSKVEKLHRLGMKLIKDHSGYTDQAPLPPWHVASTTTTFFRRQIGRMGKSLTP